MRKMGNFYFIMALLLSDAVMAGVAIPLAYYLRFDSQFFLFQQKHALSYYLPLVPLEACFVLAVFALHALYKPKRSISWLDEASTIFSSVSIATVLTVAVGSVISQDFGYSLFLLVLAWLVCTGLIIVGRGIAYIVLALLRSQEENADRILVVGTGEVARTAVSKMQRTPSLGCKPVGALADDGHTVTLEGIPVLGKIDDIGDVIRAHKIDEVVVAVPNLSKDRLTDIIHKCQGARVGIMVLPDLYEIIVSQAHITDLGGLPVVTVRDIALRGWNLVVKRALDIAVSATGLIVLSPLLLLLALVVKLGCPRAPVFYTQERVGLDGKPFHLVKFRSMKPEAEQRSGPVWATSDDPRRTRLGRLLRRFSLDELPQLVNVLIGEMSLVGPRPERPFFVEQFKQKIPRYFERHNEKAGLTGWAQVNGLRGNTSIEERTAYDLWYVENWNVWLDIKIMLRTVTTVLTDRNAY